jgi:hypothetical protein
MTTAFTRDYAFSASRECTNRFFVWSAQILIFCSDRGKIERGSARNKNKRSTFERSRPKIATMYAQVVRAACAQGQACGCFGDGGNEGGMELRRIVAESVCKASRGREGRAEASSVP